MSEAPPAAYNSLEFWVINEMTAPSVSGMLDRMIFVVCEFPIQDVKNLDICIRMLVVRAGVATLDT